MSVSVSVLSQSYKYPGERAKSSGVIMQFFYLQQTLAHIKSYWHQPNKAKNTPGLITFSSYQTILKPYFCLKYFQNKHDILNKQIKSQKSKVKMLWSGAAVDNHHLKYGEKETVVKRGPCVTLLIVTDKFCLSCTLHNNLHNITFFLKQVGLMLHHFLPEVSI